MRDSFHWPTGFAARPGRVEVVEGGHAVGGKSGVLVLRVVDELVLERVVVGRLARKLREAVQDAAVGALRDLPLEDELEVAVLLAGDEVARLAPLVHVEAAVGLDHPAGFGEAVLQVPAPGRGALAVEEDRPLTGRPLGQDRAGGQQDQGRHARSRSSCLSSSSPFRGHRLPGPRASQVSARAERTDSRRPGWPAPARPRARPRRRRSAASGWAPPSPGRDRRGHAQEEEDARDLLLVEREVLGGGGHAAASRSTGPRRPRASASAACRSVSSGSL